MLRGDNIDTAVDTEMTAPPTSDSSTPLRRSSRQRQSPANLSMNDIYDYPDNKKTSRRRLKYSPSKQSNLESLKEEVVDATQPTLNQNESIIGHQKVESYLCVDPTIPPPVFPTDDGELVDATSIVGTSVPAAIVPLNFESGKIVIANVKRKLLNMN